MKINLKLCLLIVTLVFSGQSLKAVSIWNDDLQKLDFERVASCLKEKKPVPVGDQEYAVCEKRPEVNPCYKSKTGPLKIMNPTDLENLPSPLPIFWTFNVEEDPAHEYLTVNFTTNSNPHWDNKLHSPVPMEKRYWNETYWSDGCLTSIPTLFVTFLLKKNNKEII